MRTRDYVLGLYEKALPASLSWEERLAAAAQGGFDYLEMSVDESDERLARLEWGASERVVVRRAMEATGVPVRSICLSAHRKYPLGATDPATRARSLQIMERAIELACDLGVRTIQLAGYDVYYEEGTAETRAWFAEGLERAVGMAARAGVLLGFETMETPFMDTVAKAMAYVRAIDSPYLGVYPDAGNLTNASLIYGMPVFDDVRLGTGRIVAAHLKETCAGRYREVPFGTGTTDYAGALDALVAQGVSRFVGEFWYVGAEDWQADVAFASRYLRERIDAAIARAEAAEAPAAAAVASGAATAATAGFINE